MLSFQLLLPITANAAGALIDSPIRGTYIYMTHRASEGLAADIAMSRCMQRYGGGCRVLTTYSSGCLAIAQSQDGSHNSGWAVKSSKREANLVAIGECAKHGGSCYSNVSVCE
jgi:hypothetical protein